jgi:hypothetical protein
MRQWSTFQEQERTQGMRSMIKTILRAAFCLLFFGAPAHAQPVSPWSRFDKGWQNLITIQHNRRAVNGECGPANGVATNVKPTTGLCSASRSSRVTGTGPWTWSCVGARTTAHCSDTLSSSNPPTSGQCGPANGVAVTTVPTTSLCTAGTATTVTGTGPWAWMCDGSNGGTNSSCSAPLQSVLPL